MTNRVSSIVEALLNPKNQPPPQDPSQVVPPATPLNFDPALEQAAAPNNNAMNPMVQALAQKMGLLALIRNRSNAQVVDPSQMP